MKAVERWHSARIGADLTLVRWGTFGTPVLLFPTAGGDAEEVERFGLVDALGGLLAAGRIKVYSIDSLAGASLLRHDDTRHTAWLFGASSAALRHEVVPAIRADCSDPTIETIAAGASIGAFNAVSALCGHPDLFSAALGMSGTYDLSGLFGGGFSDDFYFTSPLHYLPGLDGPQLDGIRRRFVVLATGAGEWEDPGESWAMGNVLGAKGIPNRVDVWSKGHPHDWQTWREMLPLYLDDLVP